MMIFERSIVTIGGSTGLTLKKDLLNFLSWQKGDQIIVEDALGEDGFPYLIVKKKRMNDGYSTPITE